MPRRRLVIHHWTGSGQSSHSAMPRPMIHSLSASERKSSSSVNNVTTCL